MYSSKADSASSRARLSTAAVQTGPRANDALLQGTRRRPASLAWRLVIEVDGTLAVLGIALRKGALADDGDLLLVGGGAVQRRRRISGSPAPPPR